MDNQSATYRGYRRQALYILWRLLTDAECDSRSYRPEHEEDLGIYDAGGRLLEAVQVKDYSAPLSLSDFKPSSPEGFFSRMKHRHEEHPKCRHILASFGPLGKEIGGAIAGNGTDRDLVAAKLHDKNSAISRVEAGQLLASLKGNIESLDEAKLWADTLAALEGTVAGIHSESAVELLLYWVYDASERKAALTKSSYLLKLQRIGEYLATVRDYATEWMVSIRPLQEMALTREDTERLRLEYRHGAQAQWKHILAGADCHRCHCLFELHDKLSRHSVVVVRGASGQGKSSLALRYMFDYVPEGLRFHIRNVESRTHALRLANALRGHVERLRLRAIVLLDISPSDSGWVELVRELADAGLRVLVAIREEDFHRAATLVSDLDFEEIALDAITREEAGAIYTALTAQEVAPATLDFDEAWARFTTGESGPLLEFTHLVNEGETLTKKITGQVARLQAEARTNDSGRGVTVGHLTLLALAAIANAAECRLSLEGLCSAAKLDSITDPLAVLEDEYLLCKVDVRGETTVGGVHALRSKVVEAALFAGCPDKWGEMASVCLGLVIDEDVERFLLSAFSQHPEFSSSLESAVRSLQLRSWTHAGGLCRALIWEGVNRYERENHEVLSAAVTEHDAAWSLLCDPYVGFDKEMGEEVRTKLEGIAKRKLPQVQLTSKKSVFLPLRKWGASVEPPTVPPTTAMDWVMVGDLAFWMGTERICGPIFNALKNLLPATLPECLSIEELGQFISGRFALGDASFLDWHARHSANLSARFVRETKSIHLSDNGCEVMVFFPAFIADPSVPPKTEDASLHERAMQRVRLLRNLFPHRTKFCSKGLGMEALAGFYSHDPTIKAIPVENLPPERAVHLNGMFINLVAYRLQRAASWRAYAEERLRLRRAYCDCFRNLHRAWGHLLEEPRKETRNLRRLPIVEIEQIEAWSHLQMFPRTSVDEWGFVSEDEAKALDGNSPQYSLWGSLSRFKKWQKLWREYESSAKNVVRGIVETTVSHLEQKEIASGESPKPNAGQLLLFNLASAWEALADMQEEYRRWFAPYLAPQKLCELEAHEGSNYRHLWAAAIALVPQPGCSVEGAPRPFEMDAHSLRAGFLRNLSREIESVLGEPQTHRVRDHSWVIDGKKCLVVVCNHSSLARMDALRPQVVLAIWRAARAVGWRHLEWTPLIVEWPYIFVTHLLCGRALFSGGAFLFSSVMFGTETDFKVQNHHMVDLPVPDNDYRAAGLALWDTPLLATTLKFQANAVVFTLTILRTYSLLNLAQEQSLSQKDLQPCLEEYSREVSRVWRTAIDSYDELIGLLRVLSAQPEGHAAIIAKWLTRLELLCGVQLLLPSEPGVALTLSIDWFAKWLAQSESSLAEMKSIVQELLEFAIEEESKALGS